MSRSSNPLASFRTARWLRTLNLVLQAVLLVTLVGGLNSLARNHGWRFDLTRYRRFSLSGETRSYLKDLAQPIRILVTTSDASDEPGPEVRGLLEEYVHATEGNRDGRISVEYVDVYQDRRKVEQYQIEQPGVILFVCGGRRTVKTLSELYRVRNQVREAFIGEQIVTAAILDVSNPTRKKILFLVGHGELRPDDVDPARGLSTVRDELKLRNFDVDTLNLPVARAIPSGALLIAVSPQSAYSRFEQELLRQYLEKNAGRLILFLAPGVPHGLGDLLVDWNVMVDDDVILDTGSNNLTEEGDLMIWAYQPHPITQTLIDYKVPLRLGATRSVRPLPGQPPGGGLTVVTLAATSTTAWGEVGYRQRGPQSFTPGIDIKGLPQMDPKDRLGVAVASERVAVRGNLPFSVPGGRLVVVGTGDLISNGRIANPGCLPFFLGAVNWTVGRDAPINAPSHPVDRFQLSLSAGDLARMRYTLALALPGLAALLGIAVYWTRRR